MIGYVLNMTEKALKSAETIDDINGALNLHLNRLTAGMCQLRLSGDILVLCLISLEKENYNEKT